MLALPPSVARAGQGRDLDDPRAFRHRVERTNGIRMHFIDEGEGPLVILLHGFPYLWYAWRRQIAVLAAAGYRIVAPDLRGFGRTDCPSDVDRYGILQSVGDLVGLLPKVGVESAVVVGHDLGAWVAYAATQARPDLFHALVMLNTPVGPREDVKPSESWKRLHDATGKRLHHDYFQSPGVADAELNADIRRSLRSIHFSVSGAASNAERWRPLLATEESLLDTTTDPVVLPDFLSEVALDHYVAEFARNGFTGPLNHYRARDRSWEQTAFLARKPVTQPSLFIGGAADPALELIMPMYERLEEHLTELRSKMLLPGVGHSAAEERPGEVSGLLLSFLASLPVARWT